MIPLISRNVAATLLALLVVACVILVNPGQAVAQSPLAFKNSTNQSVTIQNLSITTGFGQVLPVQGTWTIAPGQAPGLTTGLNNDKIYAYKGEKVVCLINVGGTVKSWTWNMNGLAADGYFEMVFTPANLQAHLGQVAQPLPVQPNFPFNPPAPNGPTQQQINNALLAIGLTAVAHEAAWQNAKKPNADFGAAFALQIAKAARTTAIKQQLPQLFPKLNGQQVSNLGLLIERGLDGQLNFGADVQNAKQQLINDLYAVDPNLADVAVIADFIWLVSQSKSK